MTQQSHFWAYTSAFYSTCYSSCLIERTEVLVASCCAAQGAHEELCDGPEGGVEAGRRRKRKPVCIQTADPHWRTAESSNIIKQLYSK